MTKAQKENLFRNLQLVAVVLSLLMSVGSLAYAAGALTTRVAATENAIEDCDETTSADYRRLEATMNHRFDRLEDRFAEEIGELRKLVIGQQDK